MPQSKTVGRAIAIIATVGILGATLTPAPGETPPAGLCVICGALGGVDAILNVLLFLPLGIGLALAEIGWQKALVGALALSLGAELAQIFIPGRDPSVGDVITNAFGAGLGFLLCAHARTWLVPTGRARTKVFLLACSAYLIIQAAVSFALSTFIPRSSTYYGQLARELGNYELFRGTVLDARIDKLPIPDTELPNTDSLRRMLGTGALLSTTVRPKGLSSDLAPMVRVVDDRGDEVVLLAQRGRDFVFGLSTGASLLRLRPPLFSLADAFPDTANSGEGGPQVSLSGTVRGGRTELRKVDEETRSEKLLSVTSALGWTVFLPFQWVIRATAIEQLIGWIWIGLLSFPLGYFASFAGVKGVSVNDGRAAIVTVTIALMVQAVGLVVFPLSLRLSAAPVGIWLATVVGMSAGIAAALRMQTAFSSRDSFANPKRD
jgi:hypothetical protein